ncbi:hypothetical protein ACI2LM_15910 [Paenibacillus lautus]|uniref:hypothetical protein n=1 Tax=Paenibacillus lautus TaxID=1401 RepID=UPI003850C270
MIMISSITRVGNRENERIIEVSDIEKLTPAERERLFSFYEPHNKLESASSVESVHCMSWDEYNDMLNNAEKVDLQTQQPTAEPEPIKEG